MSKSQYVHLHAHTEYSLLDGLTRVEELVRHTAERGDPAVAKTDHGSLFATLKFLDAGKKYGIKTIVGMEAYIAPRGRKDRTHRDTAHLTLLAADEEGYKNLRILSTLAFTEGTYYKPRIDNELLYKYNKGIICLSGCLSGVIQQALMKDDYDKAIKEAKEYKEIFGNRFYLEMMRHNLEPQERVERGMSKLREELNVPFVATNDSHYLKHDDCTAHEVLLCIGTQDVMSNDKRFRLDTPEFFVKSNAEMREIFHDIPEACDETVRIAEMVDLKVPKPTFHIPLYPVPSTTKAELHSGIRPTPDEYLRSLCYGGVAKRYGKRASEPKIKNRIDDELGVIKDMGFASYFLIVWDFIKYARDNDIPVGPGRGSAVGSIVSYALRITDLDPLEHGLIFERFLNPERVSMPDIDTDFCINGREQVVQYVAAKYGRERVAGISTFGTLQSRAAIKDTARAYGLEIGTSTMLAKLVPSGPKGLSISEARAKISQIAAMEESNPQIRRILDMAQNIEKNVRHAGTHAAGVVISDVDLVEYVALCTASKNASEDQILNTQEDMNWVEKLGLLKMDFLGLRNLTIMETAAKSIRKKVPDFRLEDIPIDDKDTYSMIATGDTDGVFQLESGGMKKLMRDMQPDRFNDIVAAISLFRPGPMELIPQYIAGKRGELIPPSLHPALDEILKETYGVACYQEQVMQMAREIGGYSMAEADFLRKIMGKKKMDEVADAKIKFIDSAVKNNVEENIAAKIFSFIEPFAGYGFNKCAHGSTEIQLPDRTRMTLSAAYKNPPKEIMSMWSDGTIRPHRIERIVRTGNKPLLHIRTASGKTIKTTSEHRLLTTEGYKEVGKMIVGTELITAPRYVTENQRQARKKSITRLNKTIQQRERVSKRVKDYQDRRPLKDKQDHMLRMDEKYPELTRNAITAMHEKLKWLFANDASWKEKFIRKSIASTRAAYNRGPGYGTCSIASNGMWCASTPERNMCEWLIENEVEFEMHKVLANGRICDFYFSGIYWEMDGMDRAPEYFANKYDELPYVVVTPEDFKPSVLKHLGIGHAQNGDPILSITPCDSAMTYDIEMSADGPLNYIANRIVSHNSHAVAYGWITYQTAWLKRKYPSEYFAALLASVDDDPEQMAEYVSSAKRHGVIITPPDINESGPTFTVTSNGIKFGLASAKGLTADSLTGVLQEREKNGLYTSLDNLVERNRGDHIESQLQRKHVEIMTKSGALDCFGEDRGRLLKWIDPVFARHDAEERHRRDGLVSLFGNTPATQTKTTLKKERKSSARERLAWEYETLGVYVSGHPADAIRKIPEYATLPSIADVKNDAGDDEVTIAGVLRNIVKKTTKQGKMMARATVEDISGSIAVIIFPKQMRRVEDSLLGGKLVIVRGQRQSAEQKIKDDKPPTPSSDESAESLIHVEDKTTTELIVQSIEIIKPPSDDGNP